MIKFFDTLTSILVTIFLGLVLIVGGLASYSVYNKYTTPVIHNLYLTGEIKYTKDNELAQKINNVEDGVINLYITSTGGNVIAAKQIINAIKLAKQRDVVINTYVSGFATSAAALIYCYGTNTHLDDTSLLMYHTYRSSTVDENGQLLVTVLTEDFVKKQDDEMIKVLFKLMKKQLKACNIPEKDRKKIYKGEDVYYTKDNAPKVSNSVKGYLKDKYER